MQNLFDHEISSKEFTLEIASVKESSCWFFHVEGESTLFFLTDFTVMCDMEGVYLHTRFQSYPI